MLFITHALVGAALGKYLQNPFIGFLAGFLSHHIIDALPHFDQGSLHIPQGRAIYLGKGAPDDTLENFGKLDWLILAGDLFLTAAIFAILFFNSKNLQLLPVLAGSLGGVMPDIIGSSPLWSEKLKTKSKLLQKYGWFHAVFHWTAPKNDWIVGLSTQIILIAVSLLFIAIH